MIKLYVELETKEAFGRAEVMYILDMSSTSAGELLLKMEKAGFIEKVNGYGKGKYHFC